MSGPNALHEAFVRGDIDAVCALLGAPADFPNTRGPDWLGNLLVYAIYWSPLAAVRALLDLGADPNLEVNDGFPPLIAATVRRPPAGLDDRAEVIGLLLERGADPNVRGLNDGTPLHHVVWRRRRDDGAQLPAWTQHVDAARLLLAHGADPNLRTRIDDCTSALDDAVAAGVGATELAALLAQRGAR